MDLFKKIDEAVNTCESSLIDNVSVQLTYADLKEIRKLVLVESFRETASVNNLRAGMEFGRKLKSK